MKRFFFVVLTLVFFLVSFSSVAAEEDYVFADPWQNSDVSAFDLIKDGYRLVGVQAPPLSAAEILYLQKKDVLYRCATYKSKGPEVEHSCKQLVKSDKFVSFASAKYMAIKTLMDMAIAQEDYYQKHKSYSSSLEKLIKAGLIISKNVRVEIAYGHDVSWKASAWHGAYYPEIYVYDSGKGGLQD